MEWWEGFHSLFGTSAKPSLTSNLTLQVQEERSGRALQGSLWHLRAVLLTEASFLCQKLCKFFCTVTQTHSERKKLSRGSEGLCQEVSSRQNRCIISFWKITSLYEQPLISLPPNIGGRLPFWKVSLLHKEVIYLLLLGDVFTGRAKYTLCSSRFSKHCDGTFLNTLQQSPPTHWLLGWEHTGGWICSASWATGPFKAAWPLWHHGHLHPTGTSLSQGAAKQ